MRRQYRQFTTMVAQAPELLATDPGDAGPCRAYNMRKDSVPRVVVEVQTIHTNWPHAVLRDKRLLF